jgi:hypothetical protein
VCITNSNSGGVRDRIFVALTQSRITSGRNQE